MHIMIIIIILIILKNRTAFSRFRVTYSFKFEEIPIARCLQLYCSAYIYMYRRDNHVLSMLTTKYNTLLRNRERKICFFNLSYIRPSATPPILLL